MKALKALEEDIQKPELNLSSAERTSLKSPRKFHNPCLEDFREIRSNQRARFIERSCGPYTFTTLITTEDPNKEPRMDGKQACLMTSVLDKIEGFQMRTRPPKRLLALTHSALNIPAP
jgi:hypothetical protein